ncbi:MAG: rod shape-determining protein MreC [Nitrospirae bacterium]|nr:rod shape-determining protein MreC [Nitrospirota bacterium]
MLRSASGTKRVKFLLLALLLTLAVVLPKQGRQLLQEIGAPIADLLSFPIQAFAALDRSISETWAGYIALRQVHEENRRLQREIQLLRGRQNELRELAYASQRLATLLQLKERTIPSTVAANVVGQDTTNWYRGVVLDKGQRDGVRAEMGVITVAGAVGRVVKASQFTSVVLLVTDPNNAVTGLIQRTRDEGIVEGTLGGRARMKYIPLLSTVQVGDAVVTSGLTGGFPKGIRIGTIASIQKEEGDLFQSAELIPEVDFSQLEEVLVITGVRPVEEVDTGPAIGETS